MVRQVVQVPMLPLEIVDTDEPIADHTGEPDESGEIDRANATCLRVRALSPRSLHGTLRRLRVCQRI